MICKIRHPSHYLERILGLILVHMINKKKDGSFLDRLKVSEVAVALHFILL